MSTTRIPRDTLPPWKVIGATLLLAGVTVPVVRAARRRPYLAVGWFWYLGTLVPVIGLVQVATQAMADRYTYVPLIGLFIMAAWGIPNLLDPDKRPLVLVPAAAAALILCAVYTRAQVHYWHDSETLWQHTLEVTADNYAVHNNLGLTYLNRGQIAEAREQFAAALRIRPNLPGLHTNFGLTFLQEGKTDEALRHFGDALRLDPHHANANTQMGMVLLQRGEIDRAVEHFRAALRKFPDLAAAHNGIGAALLLRGENGDAAGHFAAVLEKHPDRAGAHHNLAEARAAQGQFQEAVAGYEHAVRLQPEDVRYRCNLAWALDQLGQTEAAQAHYRRALALHPELARALNEAAETLLKRKDLAPAEVARALRIAQQACRLSADRQPEMLATLAAAYATAGRLDEAVTAARKARELAIRTKKGDLASQLDERVREYEKGRGRE